MVRVLRNFWESKWPGVFLALVLVATVALSGVILQSPSKATGGKVEVTFASASAAAATDYTWVTYADGQTILNAVAAAGGGTVQMLGGDFDFGGHTITCTCNNIQIIGAGNSTYLHNGGISAGSNSGWTFESIRTDATGIVYSSATNVTLIAVDLNGTYIGMQTAGNVTATTLNAPTGRTASYVIAASNSSDLDKRNADVVCTGTNDIATIQAAVNALVALGNMPDGEGTNTTTGVQGEIYFFDGLYTGTGQLTIPAGSRIALMGESPPSFHPSNSYTAPLAYLGGVEIYFTGTTYPVLSLPLSSNSIPDTTLELNNITFMVKNPVSQQATGVYAFSMPGYVKGDWGYVNFLSDVATSAGGAFYNANIEGLDLEAGAHTDIKTWETITIGGFQGNVLHVNTDHMNIDNICMFDCYNAPSPDVLTALYWATVTGIINNMSVENVPIAVLNSSGNLEGPIINTLTLEGTCNQGLIQSTAGGMITIGTLNNLSGSTPLSYAMTQANISKVQYGYAFPADHTTANINSSYNFGISSQTYISQLLNTLGDTRALWLPADAPANASASFTSIKDRTNNNNNLTASSDINGWTNQAWFKGQCQILETDGSSNYLTAASNANMSFTNGTFSLVMMVKFDTMPTWGWILSKTDSNANQEYQVYEYGNEIRVQVFDNVNGGHYERASNAITTNTWYCIVITCNGTLSTGLHIYVNGVLDDVGGAESLTGTCTSMDATSAPVYIAALDNNGSVANYFPGNIGITAITGTCLTQAQVTSATALIKGMMQIP